MDIRGKVALVTGAATGIGLSIVKELLNEDAKGVLIVDINIEAGETARKKLAIKYGDVRILFHPANVTLENEYEDAFKKAIDKFGRLDIVVNNAGIMNDINYSLCIDTNLTAIIRGTVLGLKYMGIDNEGNGGLIMNISSIAAFELQHYCPVYSASKAGILNMVRGFGNSFFYEQTGVKVLALCPGGTVTSIYNNASFREGCLEELIRHFITKPIQTPDTVGRLTMEVFKHGESGSIWIVEDNNLYKLKEPNWNDCKELITNGNLI